MHTGLVVHAYEHGDWDLTYRIQWVQRAFHLAWVRPIFNILLEAIGFIYLEPVIV